MHTRTYLSVLLFLLLLGDASTKGACDAPSDRSCCDPQCNCFVDGAVCKLVCTTKIIETVCYGCESEKICVPGPSRRCETCCQQACKCDCRSVLVWTKWIPHCAEIVCRTKLKKYVVTKQVPSYKWVVVPACQCDVATDITKPAPRDSELGEELVATDDEIISLTSANRLVRKNATELKPISTEKTAQQANRPVFVRSLFR